MDYPEGPFQIKLCDDNLFLDIKQGASGPGAEIILSRDRIDDSDNNRIWINEDGLIKNLLSGLALTVSGSQVDSGFTQEATDDRYSVAQYYSFQESTFYPAVNGNAAIGTTSTSDGTRPPPRNYLQRNEIPPLLAIALVSSS